MQSNLINQSQKMRITKLATKLQTEAYLIISKGKYVIISRPGLMLKKRKKIIPIPSLLPAIIPKMA